MPLEYIYETDEIYIIYGSCAITVVYPYVSIGKSREN